VVKGSPSGLGGGCQADHSFDAGGRSAGTVVEGFELIGGEFGRVEILAWDNSNFCQRPTAPFIWSWDCTGQRKRRLRSCHRFRNMATASSGSGAVSRLRNELKAWRC
jgi:hypothetical protein